MANEKPNERNEGDESAARRQSLNGAGAQGASAEAPPSLVSQVKALAEALKGSDVGELDLTDEDTRIIIRRQLEPTMLAPRGETFAQPPAPRRAPDAEQPPAPDPGVAVVAPLTGVFYTSASPNTPPFVSIGENVSVGQVVCIVEAMKVFNEIKSEVAGVVTAIAAQNGQLVQKGEALIRLKSF